MLKLDDNLTYSIFPQFSNKIVQGWYWRLLCQTQEIKKSYRKSLWPQSFAAPKTVPPYWSWTSWSRCSTSHSWFTSLIGAESAAAAGKWPRDLSHRELTWYSLVTRFEIVIAVPGTKIKRRDSTVFKVVRTEQDPLKS